METSKRKPLSEKARVWLKARASEAEWAEIMRREDDAEAVYSYVADIAPACYREMIEANLMPPDMKIFSDSPKVTDAAIVEGKGRWRDVNAVLAEQEAARAELRRRARSEEIEIAPEPLFDTDYNDIQPWGFGR